jgi:hypothetical protein
MSISKVDTRHELTPNLDIDIMRLESQTRDWVGENMSSRAVLVQKDSIEELNSVGLRAALYT